MASPALRPLFVPASFAATFEDLAGARGRREVTKEQFVAWGAAHPVHVMDGGSSGGGDGGGV